MKIDELNAIKDKMKNQVTLRAEDPDSTKVLVAMGTCGIAAGARDVLKAFADGVAEKNIEKSYGFTNRLYWKLSAGTYC